MKVAFMLPAHALMLLRSLALPCVGARGWALGQLCWGVLAALVGIGNFCSNPPPLWPLLSPQHTLKMLEPASTL